MRHSIRIPLRRALAALSALCALIAVFASATPAAAAPYAALVMDMRTGEIVHSRGADRRQHPASLTKLMTLYLTFEAVKTGQLTLDTRVRVSRKAARQPPSKLGLKQGQRVRVRDLIRATAIKSANDAAMVLAEAIGGSQRGFAKLMTAKARALGMPDTTFRNPHGLTQQGHLSTARDMARLARALYFDYPQYYNVFGRTSARAAGRRINTTNRLLASYKGAEGMKTGYTRAAGYNLVATAQRGPRRVLAVLMGGKSSRWRNRRMARLLDMGFERTPLRAAEVAPSRAKVRVARAPMPTSRPATKSVGVAALADLVAPQSAVAALNDPGSRLPPLYADPPRMRPGARRAGGAAADRAVADAAARRILASLSADAIAGGAPSSPAVPMPQARPSAPGSGGWKVQVGAYRDRDSAITRLETIRLAGLPMLSRGASAIEHRRSRAGRPIYFVRFHGLDAAEARDACARLKKSGRDCLALAPR